MGQPNIQPPGYCSRHYAAQKQTPLLMLKFHDEAAGARRMARRFAAELQIRSGRHRIVSESLKILLDEPVWKQKGTAAFQRVAAIPTIGRNIRRLAP